MVINLLNKTFKLLLITLIMMAGLFAYISPNKVNAETNSTTVRITATDVTYLYGPNSGNPVRMIDRLRNSDNNVVFCINFNLPSPNGLDYNEAERLDNATTYLLNAFYKGNSTLTGNKAYDEYLIQAAIHNIKSPSSFSLTNDGGQLYVDNDGSHTTVNKIKALVTQAKAAGNTSVLAFDNQLKVSNTTVSSTLNNNKFISAPVTVTTKGSGTITAKLIGATTNSYVGDENGNPIVEIKNGTKVTIVVPTNDLKGKALQPKLQLTGDFKQAYQVAKRLTGQASYQDIATYGLDEFKEKKTTMFITSIGAVSGSIEGVKIADSNKPLQGAKIEVRDSQDNTVKVVTTALDGAWNVSNLSFGEYYWLETGTIDGYVLNGGKHAFTIDYNHVNVNAGNFVNKLKKGFIEGIKIDVDTNEALAGAEFTLTDSNGEKQVVTTKDNGTFKFNIEGGEKYTLEETKTPKGYKGTFKQENITLKDDGQIFKIIAKNKIKKGLLEVIKVDKKTRAKLAGAEFTLMDNDGEKQVAITSEKGLANFELKANKVYTLTETKTPEGYSGQYKQSNITLKNDGEIVKMVIENTKVVKAIPKTGDKSNNGTLIGGSLVVLAALSYLFGSIYLKRKEV
ncbi:SpaA isopeptide-forming pilin-related protein [Listeria monocytogenes]|uniref:SpaA isopeptide-forming pilin-related protein n=1 Tax=Listeria monocytogenes TaxID=1639 RepID=UPI0011EAE4C6|nr:SpaA isopeptide-forming pilin-related protein [Listeria monocytogenes]TYV38981.1 LPXTG cell wall anchor domain-containing protein [Listeria monocytogenes]HAO6015951.1 LPXTG cell wall anchor domain-containing protein [Listeria monocytogenes]